MKRTIVALFSLAAVGAFTLGFLSCGSTGGHDSGNIVTGLQFVDAACNPNSNCLSLTVSPRSIAANDTDIAGFKASLRDPSGGPLAGIQLCFSMTVADVATILEPNGGCDLTDANGLVSGKLRAGHRTGSYALEVQAPQNFGLETRETIKFGQSCGISLTPTGGTLGARGNVPLKACITCADNGVLPGQAVTFSGCGAECNLSPAGATTGNDGCLGATLENTNRGAFPVQSNITATSSGVGSDTSNFVMEGASGTGTTGSPCDTDGDCNSNLFCSFGDHCTAYGNKVCTEKQGAKACCTAPAECKSGDCNPKTDTCNPVPPGAVGDPCTQDSDCNTNLFCSFGDKCFPITKSQPQQCTQKQTDGKGSCCTATNECISGQCDPKTPSTVNSSAGTCGAPATCATAGAPCGSDAVCCSVSCDKVTSKCN